MDIVIKTNTKVGRDITLEEMRRRYQAVFIGIGTHKPVKLPVEGVEVSGILYGLPFLKDIKSGEGVKGFGQRVAVIGGGNVAIDSARCSLRLGADEVHIVYRRSEAEMPADVAEIEAAKEEGVIIHASLVPKKIISRNGRIIGLETQVCTSVYDDGRFIPEFSNGAGPLILADTLVIAVGQKPDLIGFEVLEQTTGGNIKVDEATLETNLPGVFAGGDAVSGPASVIEAIADGRQASISIDKYFGGSGNIDEVLAPSEEMVQLRDIERIEGEKHRVPMSVLPVDGRISGFIPVELGYDEEKAIEESKRCLWCDLEEAKAVCRSGCPARVDAPRYIRFITQGKFGEAVAVIRERVPFPGVLGYVCMHFCETKCRRGQLDGAIAVKALKRFAIERDNGLWKQNSKFSPPTRKKVAIVGSGPAGLTAAYYLAKLGHEVTIFEAAQVVGGMMRMAIPAYRLPTDVLDKEIEEIRQATRTSQARIDS